MTESAENETSSVWLRIRAFIDANKYSVFALCNILGDSCYLGYAFYAHEGVSPYKVVGASVAFTAHALLLARGDPIERLHSERETGWPARILRRLRIISLRLVEGSWLDRKLGTETVPSAFAAQSLNGAGLLISAALYLGHGFQGTMVLQLALGILILLGCLAMAEKEHLIRVVVPRAGLVSPKAGHYFAVARALHRFATVSLTTATLTQTVLAIVTLNPFLLCAAVCFLTSNYTLTRMKPEAQSSPYGFEG